MQQRRGGGSLILISKKRRKIQSTPITADATEETENAPITVSEHHLRTTPCDFMQTMWKTPTTNCSHTTNSLSATADATE